ncbi:MAG: 50S ribosomal protein L6 [bacterium]|nr:50S ribosomal protein L6 [bacterium]
MSRVGKQPIPVPGGIEVKIQDGQVQVKGSKGSLQVPVHPQTEVVREDDALLVKVKDGEGRDAWAMWGLTRALLANAVEGVSSGFEKRLAVVGVGYRADMKGKNLDLQVGFSHPVTIAPDPGIELSVEPPPQNLEGAQVSVVIRGASKEMVGQVAANIRKGRPPEPYKGKGIRYVDEYVRRKAGKTAAG